MDSFKTPKHLELQGNLSENWRKFYQSFEIYMVAAALNTETDARKIAILLNTIGEEALEIFNNFTAKKDELKKFDVVVNLFKNYCNPKKNLRYNRYIFYNRNQEDHEQFDHFLTDIQKLIKNCDFKSESTDDMLTDRIILGIHDKDLQAKLLKTDESELTLSKTIEFCRIAEVTKIQVQKVQQESSHLNEVKASTSTSSSYNVNKNLNYNKYFNNENQLSHKNMYDNNIYRKQNLESNNYNQNERCIYCDSDHSRSQVCPARGKICKFCGKYNHFERVCKDKFKQLNMISVRNDDDETFFID